jgi:DNA sulfur modification protein DndB
MAYVFEVVKGEQRGVEYYLTTLDYGEVDGLVVLPEHFLGNKLFDDEETMQRKLMWTRVKREMKDYLLNADHAFYSALTLFMVPRDLSPLKEGEGYSFKQIGESMGQLTLRSTCILFPGDGQHRAASIQEALKEAPDLASQKVPVVLIPFRSTEMVRQLFSDLNRNAKPASKTIGLSFETRDPETLVAKAIAELVPLFNDRVNRRSNSLSASSTDVITMNTLYEACGLLAAALGINLDGVKPADRAKRVDEAAEKLAPVWKKIVGSLPAWQEVMDDEISPGEVREKFVFAHGIGWQAIAHAAKVIISSEPKTWDNALEQALRGVDWERTNSDWQNVAMIGTRMNNTAPGIRAAAGYILEQAGYSEANQQAKSYLDQLKNSRVPDSSDGDSAAATA